MITVALVTVLALITYLGFTVMVGRARVKYGVVAPATTGNPDFERYYRVQMNTLEHMVIALPAMWLFAVFSMRPDIAAGIGLMWILGRIAYAIGYYRSAHKRGPGFAISALCTLALLLGALVYIVINMIHMHQFA